MTSARCPACGAGVPPGAGWCSLCFADLRPRQPEPAAAVAATPAPPPVPELAGASPVTAEPRAEALIAAEPRVEELIAAGPGGVTLRDARIAVAAATWPCPRCGDPVPLALDACEGCGAGFLAGATGGVSMKLPVVGEVSRMSKGERLLVAALLGSVVLVLFVLLATVGGHLL